MRKFVGLLGILLCQIQPVSAQSNPYLDQAKLAAIADRVIVLASEESLEASAQETEFFDRMERLHKAAAEGKLGFKDQMALRAMDFLTPKPSRTGVGICLGFALTSTAILTAKHCSLGFKSTSGPGYALRYDLKSSEWQVSRFSQPMITMGPMPQITHPIGFLITGPDIALVKIDHSQPVNFSGSGYEFHVEAPNNSDRCFSFDWYNFQPGLEKLNVNSPELMSAVTGVRDKSDQNFLIAYLGLAEEVFDLAGNYETNGVQKSGHVKPGNSGGAIFCVNDSERISVSAVISFSLPLYGKLVGLSVVNSRVQDWIKQNL